MKQEKITAAIQRLHEEIPNIGDYYGDARLKAILRQLEDCSLDDVTEMWLDAVWEDPIRRCSNCGNLMVDGYLLGGDYACSDECRNEIYKRDCGAETDEEAYRMYLRDCYCLQDEDIEGLSSAEIEEKYDGCDISDEVMWTEWY